MKTLRSLLIIMIIAVTLTGQRASAYEKYGKALNVGLGIGYYGYVGHTIPVIHGDFEFDLAKSFTLAPFVNFYSYKSYNYWGDPHYPYRNYYYHETVMPIGVKGTYYFDRLLGAGSNWDFYLAGSLGFVIRKTTWDDGYYGQTMVDRSTGALFLDLHIGTEYHLSRKVGLFLDLSTGVSTIGLGFHL